MIPNRLVVESSSMIRQQTRFALKNKWKEAMLVVFLYMLCSLAIIGPDSFIEYDQYGNIINPTLGTSLAVGITSLYTLLVTGAFTYGVSKYALKVVRYEDTQASMVFDGFNRVFKTMGLLLFMTVRILLWSLLFVIPGIIAGIRYSLAFYIMADKPHYTISQCIEESKMLMKGNKWKMVCLNVSFIGWIVVTTLAVMALTAVVTPFTVLLPAPAEVIVISLIAAVCMLPLTAYILVGNARFYELTKPLMINQ